MSIIAVGKKNKISSLRTTERKRQQKANMAAGATDELLPEVGLIVKCCLFGRKFVYFMQISMQGELITLSLVMNYLHVRPSSQSELMK